MFGSSADKLNKALGYKTLVQCVMGYLKAQLENGKLKPGDEISVDLVCEALKVSRTPVREALIQLVFDGFVELISRRKYVIKKLSLKEIKNIYQLIGLLEAESAKIACHKMSDTDLQNLQDLYDKMLDALEKRDETNYFKLNFMSHELISRFCENPILIHIIRKLKERLYEYPKIETIIYEWDEMLMSDHKKMIKYLKKKDEKNLERVIKDEHWCFERHYPFILKFYAMSDINETQERDQ